MLSKQKTILLALVLVGLGLLGRWLLWVPAAPKTTNRSGRPILVIGHAGSGFFTPINPFNALPPSSMRGIREALEQGVDGVEIDIQLSQDSVPILYHDARFDTMTNGTGCASSQPAAVITGLHYRGGWPYDWFQHEQPVTLATLLAYLQQRGRTTGRYPYLHLDLHEQDVCAPAGQQYARSPVLVRALARVLGQYQVPPDRLLILTDQVTTLPGLRVAIPGAPLAVEIAEAEDFAGQLRAAITQQAQAVVLHKDVVTAERAAAAQAAGVAVVVFGGRSSKSLQRILSCQPDAMEVDNVPALLRLLGR